MARISTYGRDLEVSDYDAWIGTDSPTRATKQFTAKAVAEYLNIKGKISISAQMVFYYWTANSANTLTPGAGDFYGPSIGAPMTSITTMQLYKSDKSGQDVVAFMNYIVGSHILISKQNDINVFGHFLIDSYTINNPDDDFYTLNLTSIGGNGNLTELLHYDFAIFTPSSLAVDKNFVFPQNVASATWTVQHNLDKFPSCTMVLSTGQQGFGDVTFIDENNLTITFASAETGKAYIN
jgi:hypothetical protein|tara:strand:- start:1776 stop:2486 length:711 start_codon:yes stop_codon:yes gene_type:complete